MTLLNVAVPPWFALGTVAPVIVTAAVWVTVNGTAFELPVIVLFDPSL